MSGSALAGLGWKYSAQAMSQVFGTTFAQYRPTAALSPAVNGATPIAAALPGYMTQDAYQMKPKALDPAKPKCDAVFDPAVLAPGDYLVGPIEQGGVTETFFVTSIQAPAPPRAIRCNAVINVTRSIVPTVFGTQPALDTQPGNEEVVLNGWPGSMIREGRGQEGDLKLPGDVKLGGYIVLLPPSTPVVLRSGDALTNTLAAQDMRAVVAMTEETPDGWKLLVQETST